MCHTVGGVFGGVCETDGPHWNLEAEDLACLSEVAIPSSLARDRSSEYCASISSIWANDE